MIRVSTLILICLISFSDLFSQSDTILVQTLTFDDITTRRGKWVFPSENEEYRKVLMYKTLKCDAATTQDQYACGEWDYLTYIKLYDPSGQFDSTYKSHPYFTINASSPDTFNYLETPLFDHEQWYSTRVNNEDTSSFSIAQVGNPDINVPNFGIEEEGGRFYYLFTNEELLASGLTAGSITGLQLYNQTPIVFDNILIKTGFTPFDILNASTINSISFQTSIHNNGMFFQSGWNSVGLVQPIDWDGESNIVIEISYDQSTGDYYLGSLIDQKVLTAIGENHFLEFLGSGQYVNLGSNEEISGAEARTIEAWARTDAFNAGGLFQAGITGSTRRDFSLRTMGTENLWRVQLWGADLDVTLPGSSEGWHHYALTFDGSLAKLYYDGKLMGTINNVLNSGLHDIWFGRWRNSYFKGAIDDVRLWKNALTEEEISEWMNKSLTTDHPKYTDLKGHFSFNDGEGQVLEGESSTMQLTGTTVLFPPWNKFTNTQRINDFEPSNIRPSIIFEQGVYGTTTIDTTIELESIQRLPVTLLTYNNPDGDFQIAANSPIHPTIPTDTSMVWEGNNYSYIFAPENGTVVDSSYNTGTNTIYNYTKSWYDPYVEWEIGRFITPYGIGLSLGSGFTWVYDITDYAKLFSDTVELSAGNQQELIDLRFEFITGTPAREVLSMGHIWGGLRSYSYRNMDNDDVLSEKEFQVEPGAAYQKVKTRLTGHGHHSDSGNYPHCCEWKNNTHYLNVNQTNTLSWYIWQTHDCALNPVFPQGGTWPGAREGWCPGDLVKEHDFDITEFVNGQAFTLDYDITDVPADNQGMGSGNYVTDMTLYQYGPANFTTDAEIYEIISPSLTQYYERINPVCENAEIIIRNGGSDVLTSLDITYSTEGGDQETYHWTGSLKIMEKEVVQLPIPSGSFWASGGENFIVEVSSPNGQLDQYQENNRMTSKFELPDQLLPGARLRVTTNNRAAENSYKILDVNGDIVFSRSNLNSNTVYEDTLNLPNGCYTFEFLDTGDDGLSYWADPDAGTGTIAFKHPLININLKSFEPEFGRMIHYSFVMGDLVSINEPQLVEERIMVYPNPSEDGFHIRLFGFEKNARVVITEMNGKNIYNELVSIQDKHLHFPKIGAGMYLVTVSSGNKLYTEKVMVY